MSKKPRQFDIRYFRRPKPTWKPFVSGFGDVLNIWKSTDYASHHRADLGTAWSKVGSYLFHSADAIGCLAGSSHHVFDFNVKRGETNYVGRVFEYTSRHGENCHVAVYDHGDSGIDVVGVSESDEELDLDLPGQMTKQINWVEDTQSES